MQDLHHQYIGDLHEYLAVEYAKSGRSSCRKCKQHISKDQLRVGIAFDGQNFSSKNWFHLECFQFKPRHRVIDLNKLTNYIQGIDLLSKKDYQKLVSILRKDFHLLEKNEISEEEKKEIEKKRKKGVKDKSLLSEIKRTELDEIRKEEGQQLVKQHHKKASSHQQQLSSKQNDEYQKLIEKYKSYTLAELKQILEKNNQAKIGRKDELAARCADGCQFGRIPPCPKCGGGKLRFDRQNSRYYCPGYMQDTDFVRCDGCFEFGDVKRTKWLE